jgi:hypothetical protein
MFQAEQRDLIGGERFDAGDERVERCRHVVERQRYRFAMLCFGDGKLTIHIPCSSFLDA